LLLAQVDVAVLGEEVELALLSEGDGMKAAQSQNPPSRGRAAKPGATVI
jgi:hypothetical protein